MKKYYFFILSIILISFSTNITAQKKHSEKKFTVPPGKSLDAIIKADFGEMSIGRSRDSRSGNVYVEYDRDMYNFDFYYDEEYNEVFVNLDKEKLFEGFDDKDHAYFEFEVPEDVETNLDVTFKGGKMELDLGGLSLKNFILDSWAGEAKIYFTRRNKIEMDYIKIDVNFGAITIEKLGNANFKEAYIDGGIGELTVDLTGDYEQLESIVFIDLDIGEAKITLPSELGIRIKVSKWPLVSVLKMDREFTKRGKYYYSDNFERSDKKLYVTLELGLGECRVIIK